MDKNLEKLVVKEILAAVVAHSGDRLLVRAGAQAVEEFADAAIDAGALDAVFAKIKERLAERKGA